MNLIHNDLKLVKGALCRRKLLDGWHYALESNILQAKLEYMAVLEKPLGIIYHERNLLQIPAHRGQPLDFGFNLFLEVGQRVAEKILLQLNQLCKVNVIENVRSLSLLPHA